MTAEFVHHAGETVPGESTLRLRRSGNGFGFGPRVLRRVLRHQRCHRRRVFPHLFHRARKPLVERPIHQAIGKPEHHDDGKEREQQSAHHQASAELRSQDAQPPLREKFQEIAGQNKRQGHKQQKYQNGESSEEQEREALLVGVGVQKRQIERRLGKKNPKQQHCTDGQQDDDFLAAGRFLIAGWTGSSH